MPTEKKEIETRQALFAEIHRAALRWHFIRKDNGQFQRSSPQRKRETAKVSEENTDRREKISRPREKRKEKRRRTNYTNGPSNYISIVWPFFFPADMMNYQRVNLRERWRRESLSGMRGTFLDWGDRKCLREHLLVVDGTLFSYRCGFLSMRFGNLLAVIHTENRFDSRSKSANIDPCSETYQLKRQTFQKRKINWHPTAFSIFHLNLYAIQFDFIFTKCWVQ